MNQLRGYIEKEVGGKIRGFKFGTNSSAILCELENCGLPELKDIINKSAWAQQNMILAAAIANCRSKKIDIDFDKIDVGDWMDELTARGELQDLFDCMTNAAVGPNEVSPTKRAERRETAKKTELV